MKDPRELKVLDPACGSGHFLLYAFDLLVTIYEEAWEDESQARLRRDYHSLADLRRALPELILRYNLHGVDIDPRAAQIAALALWMRAQRAWKDGGIARAQRPLVTRTNIVVAEPMPGEKDLLDALCATLQPPVAAIVRDAFEDMKLAGEAGTLLRIEDTIGRGLERLASRGALFAGDEAHRWKAAEDEVYSALKRYAEAVGTGGFRRRLFAEDAARGFAFIDLCRQTYDVVLMNPPFGAGSLAAKALVARSWPRTKHDLYAAFVERGVGLLPAGGYLGAITSRTGFFLKSFQKWREEVILGQAPPTVFADLGAGVLDSAMVETAAYCLRRAS
jgi:23S rRNA G2445 N2-methylase RlmL